MANVRVIQIIVMWTGQATDEAASLQGNRQVRYYERQGVRGRL